MITSTKSSWTIAPFLLACILLMLGNSTANAARLGAEYFPNFPLINQDGETMHFYDDVIKGKVVAINFIFTQCGDSCPLETANLKRVQKLLGDRAGKDVFFYSISIDPERDTPAVLKDYMQKFKIGPGWQFLTGKKSDIDQIRKKLGMYREGEDELSDHNVNLIVGNEATGQWMKRTPFDVPQSIAWVLGERLHNHAKSRLAGKQSYANASRLPQADQGEDLFHSRCNACHTIGDEDGMGPDLKGVVERRDRSWLTRFIKEPDVMLQENDPLAQALFTKYNKVAMPNLKLNDSDIKALIQYIETESQRIKMANGG